MLEFSWVAGDFVDTGDTTLRSEMLLIPLALLSSRLSFYEIRSSGWEWSAATKKKVQQKNVLIPYGAFL